jgi:DNA primase
MTVVDDIKSRLDILEVVSRYVPLQRAGRSYKANCPFHQEKTPSFYVFPERQTWRCFGACATGGDLFSFVMRAENLEFGEALRRLAEQAGVALPSRGDRTEWQVTVQVNEATRSYFQRLLASVEGTAARGYLKQRGLAPQTINEFELGLSPGDGESLKNYLVFQGFSLEQLALAGVVRTGEDGRYADLFRGRLMIPIRDSESKLAGFGGRVLDDSGPKYLNSPRSPTFDKGRTLYALNVAKEAARQQGIVIVEGYMDAIMAHQHGFRNVVASLGTALTESQVALARRVTADITMALDPDPAGQQATLRSLESSWRVFQRTVHEKGNTERSPSITLYQRQELPELKIAVLTEGRDPDEVIRQSPEEWARVVKSGVPLLEYLFTVLSAQVDISSPQGKARVAELLFPLIAAIPEPARQDHYFQELATQLAVSPEALKASVERPHLYDREMSRRRSPRPGPRSPVASSSPFARQDRDPVEDHCLALLLQHLELRPAAGDLQPEYFRRVENREIFSHWARLSQEGEEVMAESLRASLDGELGGHLEALAHLALPPLAGQQKVVAFQDTVRRLEERYLRELKAEEELQFAEMPPDPFAEIHEEVLAVNERIRRNQRARIPLAKPLG